MPTIKNALPLRCPSPRHFSLIALLLPLLLAFSASAGGCANGPKYTEMTLPPIPAGQGRIILFRDGFPLGFGIQPNVKLNGQTAGKSVPNNFFFVDRAPGPYKVTCLTEWQHDIDIDLSAQQTLYVQTHIAPGVVVGHVWPELVTPDKAAAVLKDCTYNGPPLPKPPTNSPAS